VGDRAQPRPETAYVLATQQRRVGADEGLLHGVLRVGVAEEPRALSYQRPPVARDDDLKRGSRAVARELGESLVALGSQNRLARQPSRRGEARGRCGEEARGHISMLAHGDALVLAMEAERTA
jgi:hypothetical protein